MSLHKFMDLSIIDNLWVNLKENAEAARSFINDKIGTLNTEVVKPNFNLSIPSLGTETPTNNHGIIRQGVQNTKEFIIDNKQHIAALVLRLAGVAASAAMSYYVYKWLINKYDPTSRELQLAKAKAENLLKDIGINNIELNEYELLIASNIIAPQNIDCSWQDIGGLDEIISDLRETVIYPLKSNNFKNQRSRLIQPPKGVLLFGPPGCAKTMIAKALAKESGARFINLNVSGLFDKWYGESQKRTDAIFSLAQKIQPVIIFIDEIDSFLRSRKSVDHECTLMMKTQFMTQWDGLTTEGNNRILIIGATNRPQDVDPAILRRMPALFNIKMPDVIQRAKILKIILKDEEMCEDVDIDKLAERAVDFSGSDLKELCRCAAMNAFVNSMKEENLNNENENDDTNNQVNKIDDESNQIILRNIDFNVAFEKLDVKNLTKNNGNLFDFNFYD